MSYITPSLTYTQVAFCVNQSRTRAELADRLVDLMLGHVVMSGCRTREEVASKMADLFASDTHNFDRASFLKTCGVKDAKAPQSSKDLMKMFR